MQKTADSDDEIKIEQIEITSKATIVRMKYTNGRKTEGDPRIFSPASPNAFTLYNEDYTESYKLLDVLSVATDVYIKVPPGGSFSFFLKFERIPDTVERINVLEGKGVPEKERRAWTFYDIPLISK